METYIEKYCFDGARGMFCPALVKEATLGSEGRYVALKKAMQRRGVRFVRSPGKHYDDQPLLLDTLLPQYLGDP